MDGIGSAPPAHPHRHAVLELRSQIVPRRISNDIGKLASVKRRGNDDGVLQLEPLLEHFLQGDAVRQPACDIDLDQALFARQG